MKKCVMCGTPVEITPGPHGHYNGLCVPLVSDRRMPQDAVLLTPPLCWECRGGVILGQSWRS